ncbi:MULTISPECIES: aromatic ring-hydroxylating dioxygenase subunit alpha [unclassified Rhodococcus (in: high G+C Gram-positive bacteria)]|uniref:aromatic ring-hydroxylating oxygenase subunit alpha n=1 Tax=unclassified Rhodococcus (in: high G+C Gram-positive bacteria) TaxID=192944 RepID=UPI0027E00B7B|nr:MULTISPECIES: aromatic ring-hydroxylating dioxygenase subunit alpha [unclassified Rhodococcus (in: high G+C Gram-positive bacteria)]
MTLSNILAPSTDTDALIDRRAVGYSLEAPFYTDRRIFDLDMAAIFARHWLFSAAEAEIPDPGDFVTVDIGAYSVIIVRDDDEEVRAFHNVCRHRGSRILQQACGSVGNLVCPYHQWTYRVDGELVYAESQPPEFDRSRLGLRPVHVRTLAGLIFICLGDEPPGDLDEVAAVLEPYLSPYGLADTKVAHQVDLVEEGNWKLVMENNRECQHCDTAHPELITAYFPLFGYSENDITPRLRPVFERYRAAQDHLSNACSVTGFPRDERRELDTRITGFQVSHLPLDGGGASFGADGNPVSRKLLGDIEDERFGDLSIHMQPNAWFHMLSDHAVVFRVLPVAPGRSVVRTTWLVHADAQEGVDYDVDNLTAVWNATNLQDRDLVAGAQRGVTDPGYVPGPYSMVEGDVESFVNWYVGRLRTYLTP